MSIDKFLDYNGHHLLSILLGLLVMMVPLEGYKEIFRSALLILIGWSVGTVIIFGTLVLVAAIYFLYNKVKG
mgnify:CR=1 FL=1